MTRDIGTRRGHIRLQYNDRGAVMPNCGNSKAAERKELEEAITVVLHNRNHVVSPWGEIMPNCLCRADAKAVVRVLEGYRQKGIARPKKKVPRGR